MATNAGNAFSCKPPNFSPLAIINSLKKSVSTEQKNTDNDIHEHAAEIIVVKIFVTSTIGSFLLYLFSFLGGRVKIFLEGPKFGQYKESLVSGLTKKLNLEKKQAKLTDFSEKRRSSFLYGFLREQANLIRSFGGTAMQEVAENAKLLKSGKTHFLVNNTKSARCIAFCSTFFSYTHQINQSIAFRF